MINGALSLVVELSPETRAFLTGLVDQLARALVVDRHAVEQRIRAEIAAEQNAGAGQGGMPFGTVTSGASLAPAPAPDTATVPVVAATPSAAHPADTPAAVAPGAPPTHPNGTGAGAVSSERARTTAPAPPPAPAANRTSDPAGAAFSVGAATKKGQFTPEQTALFRAMVTTRPRPSWKAIAARVCELPGARPTEGSAYQKARAMGILGDVAAAPSGDQEDAPAPVPAPAASATVSRVGAELEPLERTATEIMQWCGFAKYKFTGRLDDARLADINAFRHGKGLPPYKLLGAPPAPPPQKPHPASYEAILRWANQRGLCMDGKLGLAVVNAKAVQLGATPFELEEPPRRAAASIIRHHQNQGDS